MQQPQLLLALLNELLLLIPVMIDVILMRNVTWKWCWTTDRKVLSLNPMFSKLPVLSKTLNPQLPSCIKCTSLWMRLVSELQDDQHNSVNGDISMQVFRS